MATAITGNTYQVKDQLKALGGRWDANSKSWMVPKETTYKNLSSNRRNCPDVTKPCRKCGTYCYGDCEASE